MLNPSTDNTTLYRQLAPTLANLPLFMHPDWLDAVCFNGKWGVVLSFDNANQLDGAMVYYEVYLKGLLSAIVMPEITPTTGVWIRLPDTHKSKLYNKYTMRKKIMETLLDQLPEKDFFVQKFNPDLTDWQPFHWRGFRQSTHYTYIIPDLGNWEQVQQNFKGSIRTDVKKAEKNVLIYQNDDVRSVYDFCAESLNRQGSRLNFSFEILDKLDKMLLQQTARRIYFAKDREGNIHSSIYIVYDLKLKTAHYLLGGSNPMFRHSGAMTLLIQTAIQQASEAGLQSFNFEGSMLPTIEYAFRAFGGILTPFYRITKTKNRFFEFLTLFFWQYK